MSFPIPLSNNTLSGSITPALAFPVKFKERYITCKKFNCLLDEEKTKSSLDLMIIKMSGYNT